MDRQEYLRQMYLKNRGIKDNSISDLAYLNTANDAKNATYTTNSLNLDNEIDASSSVNSIDKGNWLERTASTVNQVGFNIFDGALNAIEGIGDLLINGAGWIGTWFGADDQRAKDATSYDWSADVTGFLGKINDSVSIWNWNEEAMNEIWNTDYFERVDAQSWTSENETVAEWTKNISQMVGNMLPSIALTYATGGAYAAAQAGSIAGGLTTAAQVADKAQKVGKWAGLLSMGVSAAGQSSVDAIQDGASTGSALLYGALSGAVEVGTELIGGDDIAGIVLGGSTGSLGKNLVKAFVSEGTEEVMSDLVSPLVDLTYKNNSSWNEAINYLNETYTSSDFSKGLLESFTMGGIGGLIFGGTSEISTYRKLGKTGYSYVNTANEIVETKENLIKANEKGDSKKVSKYENKLNELGNKLSSLAETIGDNTNIQKRIATQMNDYVEFSKIENEINNSLNSLSDEDINNKYTKAFNNLTENYTSNVDVVAEKINDFTDKILDKYGIKVDVEFKDNFESENGKKAQYQNNHIIIDSKYKNNLEGILTHETGHAITEKMDSKAVDEIYNRIVSQKANKDFEEKIKNTNAYKNATNEDIKQDLIKKETISYYLENIIEKGGDTKNIYLETSLVKKIFEPSFYNEFKTNNEIRKQLNKLAKKSSYARKVANKYFRGQYAILASMSKYTKNAKTLLDELVRKENISETDKNILVEILRSGESKTYARESDNSSFDLIIPESEIDTIIKDIKLRERTDYLTHESEKFLNTVNEIKKEFNKFVNENKAEFTNKINEFITKAEEIVNNSQVKNSYKSILLDEIIEPLKNISEENVNKIINQLGLNEVSNEKTEKVEEPKKEKKSSKKALKETKNDDIIESEDIEDDFRRIQEEGRREFNQSSWERRSKRNNEELRRRISTNFQREMERRGYNSSTFNELILKSNKNTEFRLYENIDGKLFHDFFEISRTYLENGELVDLHENYNNDTCYLSDDGLSGFAITKEGDLISVFNVNKPKHGFLSAISSIVKEKAKTLDCYASENQNLQEMYTAKFGFKTASIMDYNMDYDHDDIAKNHNSPKVAFMVNTNAEVATKSFNKNQYNEAKAYQLSFINNEAKETSKVKTKNDDIIESEDIEDDFRRIQEESRRTPSEEVQLYHGASEEIDSTLRTRLSRVFKREIQSSRSSSGNDSRILKNTGNFKVIKNVDPKLFHDIFEINRIYLENDELVDLHENYNNDGLSSFAITKEDILIHFLFKIANR